MTDSTNKHTIVLEDGFHFVDVVCNIENHTVEATMYTPKTRPILLYTEMFVHHVDYVKKAAEECTRMMKVYDYIVGLRDTKD